MPREHKLPRHINFQELPLKSEWTPITRADRSPPAAYPYVPSPPGRMEDAGPDPPINDLFCRECAEDTLGRCRDLHTAKDRPLGEVGGGVRAAGAFDAHALSRSVTLKASSFFGQAMSEPFPLLTLRFAYLASQLPRFAWYAGHERVFRRLAANALRRSGNAARSRARPRARPVRQNRIYADMLALLRQDLANVEAGIYPLPRDHDGSLLTRLYRSWLFFDDLPEVYRRRERNGFREALNEKTRDLRPEYYLQNFHFQSGGWMTDDSAERYDTQVEVLFKGTANAMRRQALPQLFEVFSGHNQRALRLIDLGCGTGRFLDLVNQAWPRLSLLGLDLSEAYIRHARRHLRRRPRLNLLVANAEAIPAPDNSAEACHEYLCVP